MHPSFIVLRSDTYIQRIKAERTHRQLLARWTHTLKRCRHRYYRQGWRKGQSIWLALSRAGRSVLSSSVHRTASDGRDLRQWTLTWNSPCCNTKLILESLETILCMLCCRLNLAILAIAVQLRVQLFKSNHDAVSHRERDEGKGMV